MKCIDLYSIYRAVTTGPITVPFLMALGLGVSSVASNKSDKDASFGSIAFTLPVDESSTNIQNQYKK